MALSIYVLSYAWINNLFNENFWAGQPSTRFTVPYNPQLALSAISAFDEDEGSLMRPCTPTMPRRVGDVKVLLYKTPTRSVLPSKVNAKPIYARRNYFLEWVSGLAHMLATISSIGPSSGRLRMDRQVQDRLNRQACVTKRWRSLSVTRAQVK